jgi:hypothetical protein
MLRNSNPAANVRKSALAAALVAAFLMGTASVARADGDLLHERVRPIHQPITRVGAPVPNPGGVPIPIDPPRPEPIRGPRNQGIPDSAKATSGDASASWFDNLMRLLRLVDTDR